LWPPFNARRHSAQKGFNMRIRSCILLLATIFCAGCRHHRGLHAAARPLTPEQSAAVASSVLSYMQSVAHDITQDGPSAWRKHFADTPAFFMADEGRLVFPNYAAADAAIRSLESDIKQIDLKWGDDLRADPLTADFAVVAASYHELRVEKSARKIDESGFFTAVTELHDGRWQFRDAHWSVIVPPPAVP
jgi:hypothetical protein